MRLSETEQALVKAFEEFEIIDAHEHIPPEDERTGEPADVTLLFSVYTRTDLVTAGMRPADLDAMLNTALPLDYRWGLLRPYLEHIRFGSYARPAFMAAKEFYGFDDINDQTYRPLSEAMQKANTPGIYDRILRRKCKIRCALTQNWRSGYHSDLLVWVARVDHLPHVPTWEEALARGRQVGEGVETLDDYLLVIEKALAQCKREGAVGFKMVSQAFGEPNRAEAAAEFDRLRRGTVRELPPLGPLHSYLADQIFRLAAEQDLPVAVHAGMWGDFRAMSSQHMIPVFMRHPQTRFDLYHMGMPEVRPTGVIGKNFPNVWLDLAWSHIISPVMARSALDEYMDLVPMNKLIAFGGDYIKPVEKVWGHLVMARENIALVLGRRVDAGLMTEAQAISVARKWFCDNPVELYGLGARG